MHGELEAILKAWKPVEIAMPDGTGRTARPSDLRRLLEKVAIDENGCWIWTGYISHKGYGRFSFGMRPGHAHRFSYAALVGPIGGDREIDHLCRVRACVNPEHLEAVTHAENLKRRQPIGVPRDPNGMRTHCREGHELTPENTYQRPNGTRLCRTCKNAEKARYRARVAARKAER